MSEQDFEAFLSLLTKTLRAGKRHRDAIVGELRDHLLERLEELSAQGVSREEAMTRALEEFGDAAVLAAHFTAISRQRRRSMIMRTTIGTLAASVAMLVGVYAFWPSGGEAPLAPRTLMAQQGASTAPDKETEPGDRALNDATFEKLKRRVDVDFEETPLGDALAFLEETADVQFYLDRPGLDAISLGTDSPVSLRLKSISTDMALDLMLEQLDLGYTLRAGVVVVTTTDRLAEKLMVQVYDVADLRSVSKSSNPAAAASPAEQTQEALAQLAERSDSAGGFGGGPAVHFRVPLLESMLQLVARRDSMLEQGNAEAAQNAERELYQIARTVLRPDVADRGYEELVDMVIESIAPDSWSDVGGPGAVVVFQDKLVVTQTLKNHRLIEDLLEQLRSIDKLRAASSSK